MECNDDLSADRSFSNLAAEFRSHSRPAAQHSYAEKLKAVRRHYSERCKSFEISSLEPLAADTAESLHLKEIDCFHSFVSCDHQENSFQNRDVAGNFADVI